MGRSLEGRHILPFRLMRQGMEKQVKKYVGMTRKIDSFSATMPKSVVKHNVSIKNWSDTVLLNGID